MDPVNVLVIKKNQEIWLKVHDDGTIESDRGIEKQYKNKHGYMRISIGSPCFELKVHRLVAQAFIPNPQRKKQVNHIDGNKENNHVSNLEWATPKENVEHAVKLGLLKCPVGGESRRAKNMDPVLQFTLDGKFVASYPTAREAAKAMGCSDSAINNAIHGYNGWKKAVGYIWTRGSRCLKEKDSKPQ